MGKDKDALAAEIARAAAKEDEEKLAELAAEVPKENGIYKI